MGLRDAFWKLLSVGSAPDRDPEAWCELVTVPSFEAPLLLSALQDHDIEARSDEAFNLVSTTLSDTRILVATVDLEAAQAVITARVDDAER